MNIDIKRTKDYNVKCYKGVKLKLKYLSIGEAEDVMEYIPPIVDIDGTKKSPARMAYDTVKMLKYMVIEIENLTLTEGDKITEIQNGKDIAINPGLDELYIELCPILLKMDARVDAKN